MVVFDLQCARGHAFEGWFENLADLEDQVARGFLTCPVCGGQQVQRVPSGFGIAKRRGEPDSADAARILGQAFSRFLRENFEDVGASFASEALKIHYGASEPRSIRGVSTPQEEDMLRQEGVSFVKIGPPVPLPDPDGSDSD
ncbi:MAG: DUF1178 family protein [Desulfarculus sp.]|nr:DUF1178 family protein [Desulfarculus sp.]